MTELMSHTVVVEIDPPPAAYERITRLWTGYEDMVLKEKWADGVRCSLIAAELGRTKNSIIGRAGRLGLPPRQAGWPRTDNNTKKKPIVDRRHPVEKRRMLHLMELEAVPEVAPMAPGEPIDGTPLLELSENQCRWPVNEPTKGEVYLFCKASKVGESSYCACHAMIAAWGGPARRSYG